MGREEKVQKYLFRVIIFLLGFLTAFFLGAWLRGKQPEKVLSPVIKPQRSEIILPQQKKSGSVHQIQFVFSTEKTERSGK